MNSVLEWWPFGATVIAGLLGHTAAQAHVKHKLDSMERRMTKAEDVIDALEKSRSADAVTLGIIQVTLTQIKDGIDSLRDEVKGKADKP